jgi:hypothetical protein
MFALLKPIPHAKAKARVTPAYSGRESPELEPGVNDQVNTLVELISRKYMSKPADNGKPILDLAPLSNFFTMDVITRLAFGHEFGYLKNETDHYNFLGIVRGLWPLMSTSADIPWIRNILFSPTFLKFFGPKPTDETGFGTLMG